MRILVFHQFLWAHYKAKIYSSLEKLIQAHPNGCFHVVHLSLSETSRLVFGEPDYSIHQYTYNVLFEKPMEATTVWGRMWASFQKIRAYKPDAINIPGYYDPAMWAVLIYAKIIGIKIVLSNDSTELDNPYVFWKESLKRLFVRLSDGFFCFGTLSADYILKLGGKESQILSKRNSVDNERILQAFLAEQQGADFILRKGKYRKYNFLFVGRFITIKNLDRLIEAFSKLEQADDWGLLLMGGGTEEELLRKKAAQHSGIAFLPPDTWLGVARNMALADVFVLPSSSEPWGLVVNEAMVCGMPVIVSNESGCSVDLVKEGANGFCFAAENVSELCEKMQFFVNNPKKISEFGRLSTQIIQEYTPEKVALEMYRGYLDILKLCS